MQRGKGRNKGGRCMLNDIPSGSQAKICCHHATGAIRQRLLDLGFVPESRVDVVRRAPLGDPIACKVANYCVTLRNSEASLIEVEIEAE
ncbi:MAG: ferrous iron transport protein A [Deltaproteobacteria bacterium]|nr:MAG: ferrous iron transport protein A [Deltaproteobacteria bacterium]